MTAFQDSYFTTFFQTKDFSGISRRYYSNYTDGQMNIDKYRKSHQSKNLKAGKTNT